VQRGSAGPGLGSFYHPLCAAGRGKQEPGPRTPVQYPDARDWRRQGFPTGDLPSACLPPDEHRPVCPLTGPILCVVASEDSDAVRRLRAEVAKMDHPSPTPPSHPTAVEALAEGPEPVQPGEPVCHNEGWRWANYAASYGGGNPDSPMSVYCVLPKGHFGKHVSKPRASLHRGKKYVYQWDER
jgi:hypothetical protein